MAGDKSLGQASTLVKELEPVCGGKAFAVAKQASVGGSAVGIGRVDVSGQMTPPPRNAAEKLIAAAASDDCVKSLVA